MFADKPGERAVPADDSGQTPGRPYVGPDYPIIWQRTVGDARNP